ncbi:Hypothetical protein A7982_01028 [Minicystis rosea]|nr:Hypothetical protein A7982_01028 [Minicystis rosea]
MNTLPPQAFLLHVVRSLTTKLPEQMSGLLEMPRFADGSAALARLADSVHARSGAEAMPPEEARWMSDRLLERWSRIAPVSLDPAVFVVAPDELWMGDRAVQAPVSLATLGIEDDWEAIWEGSVLPGPPGKTCTLSASPPAGDTAAEAVVRARVRARASGQRCVLVAEARVKLRRPRVAVSEDGRKLVVSDQTGRPAVGVRVETGDQVVTSGAGGLVELDKGMAADAGVRVEGVMVRGRR